MQCRHGIPDRIERVVELDRPPADLMRVERVEPPSVLGFTWPVDETSEGAVPRTYVEFTLEPRNGGTRLTLVETGFAQLPERSRDCANFPGR